MTKAKATKGARPSSEERAARRADRIAAGDQRRTNAAAEATERVRAAHPLTPVLEQIQQELREQSERIAALLELVRTKGGG